MCVNGLLPDEVDEESRGRFLTFIVPAPKGCNLKCSFCFIRQRQEGVEARWRNDDSDGILRPTDLARFIDEVCEQGPVVALAVQGHEPLLAESEPYTQTVLAKGKALGLPTGLVTNGVRLPEALKWLRTLAPNKMAISLDAASPEIHDRLRGVRGAWAATVEGIRRANRLLWSKTQLAVASVLTPAASSHLASMPKFLNELGITNWIVNPQLQMRRDEEGRLKSSRERVFQDLLPLQEAAAAARVRLTVDDEFDCLQHRLEGGGEAGDRPTVKTLPKAIEIVRLAPGGQCSIGREILKPVTPTAKRWRPGIINAADFVGQKLAA
jgi:MoaA/NifB/PqqE/SkfB family radical SAM enzyme